LSVYETKHSLAKFANNLDNFVYPRFIVPLVAFLPAQLAYGVALLQGDIAFVLQRYRRTQVLRSIKLMFGDEFGLVERRKMVRDYFCVRSCAKIDAMRLLGSGKALTGQVRVIGLEHLRNALSGGKGAILYSAHLGSPLSCMSVIGALGFPTAVVGRSWSFLDDRNRRLLHRLFYRLEREIPVRSHLCEPVIERKAASHFIAVRVARALQRNEFVGIMIDHDVKQTDPSKPMAFDFLNRRITLVPAGVTIARMAGAPIMVALLHRSPDWRHIVLQISPPISLESDDATTFRKCLDLIEDTIRRWPSQWALLRKVSTLARMGLVSPEEASREPRESWA